MTLSLRLHLPETHLRSEIKKLFRKLKRLNSCYQIYWKIQWLIKSKIENNCNKIELMRKSRRKFLWDKNEEILKKLYDRLIRELKKIVMKRIFHL